jgi:ferrochelatase
MKIEDIINLTDATLTNAPQIHSIEAATVYPSKVEQGDLFFSSNQEDIDKAIQNGAYAIIYDDDSIQKRDNEIAWLKVSDIKLAAFKLIRYAVLKKEALFYYLKPHEFTFLKMILTHKSNIVFIKDDWRQAFEQIINSNDTLFVGVNKDMIATITPNFKKTSSKYDGYLVSDTLFRSTFKVGGYVYQEKEITPIHIEPLLRVVDLCNKESLPYSLDKLKYTKHFKPVFIDLKLQSTRASNSDRVAIFTDNIEDIALAREYVKQSNMWVKSIVLTPPKTKIPNIDHPYWFSNEEEVREILKSIHFNYAFIYNADKSILKTMEQEYSLF